MNEVKILSSCENKLFSDCRIGRNEKGTTVMLYGCSFDNCVFDNGLRNCVFSDCKFSRCDFHGLFDCVDFVSCSFSVCAILDVWLMIVGLNGNNLIDCQVQNVVLSNSTVLSTQFDGVGIGYVYPLPYNEIRDNTFGDGCRFGCGCDDLFVSRCPSHGAFIGWKAARLPNGDVCVVKLEIPSDAKRSSGCSRKCRASKAKVLGIYALGSDIELERGLYAVSDYDDTFRYYPGATVYPDVFDEDRFTECGGGIHFFMSRFEAERYFRSLGSYVLDDVEKIKNL